MTYALDEQHLACRTPGGKASFAPMVPDSVLGLGGANLESSVTKYSGTRFPMRTPIFQVDAFTTRRFARNTAAVMPMDTYPDDETLQAIAAENNLAETAFLLPRRGDYRLRWFTPATEVPLCGHATLASAAVVMERLEPGRSTVVFRSASGPLTVNRVGAGYVMDFPARPSERIPRRPALPKRWVSFRWRSSATPSTTWLCWKARRSCGNWLRTWRQSPASTGPAVIVTVSGDRQFDFISRYFAPAKGIPEDPVTGAAHCMLTPYWADRLGKKCSAPSRPLAAAEKSSAG